MTITKKINEFLKSYKKGGYSNPDILHAIINEMKEYHAYTLGLCYKDDEIYLQIILYLLNQDGYLLRDDFLDKFADNYTLDFFFMRYLYENNLINKEIIKLFDLSKEEIQCIKNKDFDLNKKRMIRKEQEFRNSLSSNRKKPKVVMNWSIPKRIEELTIQMNNANGFLEKRRIMDNLENLIKAEKDVTPEIIIKALEERGVELDDYSHVEFTDFNAYQPVIHLYESEEDYRVGRYSFRDSFRLNFRFPGYPKLASSLYYNLTKIGEINLVKVPGLSKIFQYKLEITSWAGEKFVASLPTIPQPKFIQFMKILLATDDEMYAFDAIKDSLIKECFLYTEYSFINNQQIDTSYIIEEKEMHDLLVSDSFFKTGFYKAQKESKFLDFNTDLKIKSIVVDQETEKFIITCNLGSDLSKHFKKQDYVYKEIMTNELYKVEDKKVIISGESLPLFFPPEWFKMTTEKDNKLSYLVDNYFVNLSVIDDRDGDGTSSYFNLTKKYC